MVIITGASSGIGQACAQAFAKRGSSLILIARRLERLNQLKGDLEKRFGVDVYCFNLDIQKVDEFKKFVRSQEKLLVDVDVLINNAGLAKGLDFLQSGDFRDWDTMIDTNIKGLLYGTRLVLPFMLKKGKGHIVNIGSVAGRWTYSKGNVYSATKYAVRALTESMRLDLLGTGIRVTEIAPGMVETEFSEIRLGSREKAEAVYAGMVPLRSEDIAEAVIWSVDRPAHVNIQELVIYPIDQASPHSVYRRKS